MHHKGSALQCDLCSKGQHLQHDLDLEKKHNYHDVVHLQCEPVVRFCYFTFKFVVNTDPVLG